METRKSAFILILAAILGVCYSNENANKQDLNRKRAQEQALKLYKSACLRLQNMANWMSVFLKLKSAWTNTTTSHVMAKPDYKVVIGVVNLPKLPERPAMGKSNSECSSLKNFHVTLQTFIHYQAQLLQLKAALANTFLQTGRLRLGDKSESLKKIRNLEYLNKTLIDVFESLKLSQILFAQDNLGNMSSFKDVLRSRNISTYLLKPQSGIRQIKDDISITQGRKWTRTLFQTGDFFQNLGQILDRFFAPNIAI